MDEYITLAKPSEGIYKEKGSKFLAYAFPVQSEEDFRAYLEKLKNQHNKARHHCHAYIIDEENPMQRANDDGEPAHTAGTPILNQILSHALVNVGVVVVRYFGGTKLGASGLKNAYKEAARLALDTAEKETNPITRSITVEFDYPLTNTVMQLVNQFGLKIEKHTYTERCTYTFGVKKSMLDDVTDAFTSVHQLKVYCLPQNP